MLNVGVCVIAQLDARYNHLGKEGEAALRKAVRSKKGFNLQI